MNASLFPSLVSSIRSSSSRSLLLRHQRQRHQNYGSIAENRINQWLKEKGDEGLSNKGKPLNNDRHKTLANSLGVGHDYIHSKILADNNIRPLSVERRKQLDIKWGALQESIQARFRETTANNNDSIPISQQQYPMRVNVFILNHKKEFVEEMEELGRLAKKVNEAIISDSLRFNGRSPVRHARPFPLEERMREALKDSNGNV